MITSTKLLAQLLNQRMKKGDIFRLVSSKAFFQLFVPRVLATIYTREKIYNTVSEYEIYFWTSSMDEIKWKLMKIENLPPYFIGKQIMFRGKDYLKL